MMEKILSAITLTLMVPGTLEAQGSKPNQEIAVLAGGCFWGIEGVFQSLKGVVQAESGYAGGSAQDATYDKVSSGRTGHAEAVRVVFDPRVITYSQLLEVFFTLAHDPTQLNRQGPDYGTQYRSGIFTLSPQQADQAQKARDLYQKNFSRKIVTQITPLDKFYPAEDYHQDFMDKNPDHPYVCAWDKPKIVELQRRFPQWFKQP